MNVEITGRHIVVTPGLRVYIMKRLRKVGRMLEEDTNFHVVIDVEKERHTAEILLKSKLLDLTCRGQTSDMYASILRAIEKLERQVLKHKTKIIEGKRQRARARFMEEQSGVFSRPRSSGMGRRNGIVLEDLDRKPMTVEEAALELTGSKYPFVVFRDTDSNAVNVLYRRRDGSLALIQT